jgi:hypothetical protein
LVYVNVLCKSKSEEVKEGWRKLYAEELHNYYPSIDIIGVMKPPGVNPIAVKYVYQ